MAFRNDLRIRYVNVYDFDGIKLFIKAVTFVESTSGTMMIANIGLKYLVNVPIGIAMHSSITRKMHLESFMR